MQLDPHQLNDLKARIPRLYRRYRKVVPWLEAIGLGKKRIAGEETAEDALVFFVGKKMAETDLLPEHRFPDYLHVLLGGKRVRLSTDVVEAGPAELLGGCSCTSERPLTGGNCVGPLGAGFQGTNGGLVVNPADGVRHIVSNAHVLAGINQFPVGHAIVQPAASTQVIAHLSKATQFTPNKPMTCDAAIAAVLTGSDVEFNVKGIGMPTGTGVPMPGVVVKKSGEATYVTEGTIRFVGVSQAILGFPFHGIFFTDPIADNGDSGSFVMDGDRKILGLVFAKTAFVGQTMTACCEIASVIEALGLVGWNWTPNRPIIPEHVCVMDCLRALRSHRAP
jgi:hypothetical protein